MTRAEAKEQTRQRVIREAERLFRERGYAATSLEQIAEAAEVTKGAIYGHFASKEDLLLSARETAPTPDYVAMMNDSSSPLRERLAEFGRTVSATGNKDSLAVSLEFFAALLRNPDALKRYSAHLERLLTEFAAADDDEPEPGIDPVEIWAIGHALTMGLQIYKFVAPDLLTPEAYERAYGLLAGLYPDD